jgi:hypothetical protein
MRRCTFTPVLTGGTAALSIVRCSRRARALRSAARSFLLLVLGPAEQFASEAQGFLPQLEIARVRDGAPQGVDQLGHGGEDRLVVVGQLAGSGFWESALDNFQA